MIPGVLRAGWNPTVLHVGHSYGPTPTPEPTVAGMSLPVVAVAVGGLAVTLSLAVAWYVLGNRQ